ncbi:hypothetical protein Ciccas_002818 [Cichlidogyrus casuarinus]|uniref:Uncharacterized protein n=1 Tax=Cichlidogyrus casuarinus TaxID=1844966 RepID=A0ABD2QG69_9PLAT
MIKTRQQIYGELQSPTRIPSSFKIFVDVIHNEGFMTMFSGLSPALFRHLFYTGIRMPLYEWIRHYSPESKSSVPFEFEVSPDAPVNIEDMGQTKKGAGIHVLNAALAGIVSGAIAQFVCNPTDVLKHIKLILSAIFILSKLYHNLLLGSGGPAPSTNVYMIFRKIIEQKGVIGLWRGALPNTQRAALVNMGEMTTYDTAKHFFIDKFGFTDGPLLQFCSSSLSGFVSSCLGTPTDLIKTRMMRQVPLNIDSASSKLSKAELAALRQQMEYSGMVDCAVKIVRTEGFFALYRGFFLIWARMAPWSLTFWISYEQMRLFCGLKGF